MQPGSVNAALLLSSYLGKENEKIGHGIARSDFAGELGKLFSQKSGSTDTGTSVKKDTESTDPKTASDTTQTAGTQAVDKSSTADAQDQSSGSTCARRKKSSSTAPEERLENLKNRSKSSRKIYITNPVLVESILSELQCPAETIKACKNLQTQDGWISLKNLKELLSTQNLTDGSLGQGQIPTAQAQALLAAIVQRADGSGTGRSTFAAVKESVTSGIQQNTSGSYNIEGVRTLLDQVLQRANTAEVRKNAQSIASKTITGGATSISQNAEIAVQSTVAPRQGQTESLASNILPSFLSENSEDSGKKTQGKATQTQSETDSASQGIKLSAEALAASKAVSGPEAVVSAPGVVAKPTTESKPDPAESAEAISSGAVREDRNDLSARNTANQTTEKSDRASVLPSAATPLGAKDSDVSSRSDQTLASLAEEFGATIVSTSADKPATTTGEAATQSDAHTAAVQAQNLTVLAKETVKGTDEKISAPELQAAPDLSETAQSPGRIATRQAESSQDQPFPDYDPNRSADLAKNTGDQVDKPGEVKTEKFSATAGEASKFASASQGITTPDKPDTRNQVHSATEASKTGGGSQGTAASDKPAAPVYTVYNAAGDEVSRGGASFDNGSNGQAWQGADESLTGQTATVVQKSAAQTMEEGVSVQGHALTGIAKEVEKQLKFKDSISDAAVLQSASHRIPESRIEVPLAQQASGANIGYADPGRMASIIETFREQYRGTGGQQLVLELEPEQFGKISIKVGTKKDEVSAVVITENESARQAILKNAPNLRQSLDDQGLQLGKFQVDVDRDKTGGGNANPDWQKQGGGTSNTPVEKTVGSERIAHKPAYIRRNDGLSQVSIFA